MESPKSKPWNGMDWKKIMNKTEAITIAMDSQTLDEIRKLANKNYRSISKQIAYMLNNSIQQEKEAK